MRLFGEKRKGRGLRISLELLYVKPGPQKSFASLGGKLPQYFEKVTGSFEPEPQGRAFTNITITCKDAKFELKPSDAERFYTDLFYEYYADSQQAMHQGQILAGAIREFGQAITFRPKENPQELIPIFPMREIWSRLYVRDFNERYRGNRPKLSNLLQTKASVLSKDDTNLPEQIMIPQKDYRTFVSKHAEQIIALSWKLQGGESWEAGFRRDGGELIKRQIDEAMKSPTNDVIWAPMPVSEGDVSAITEFTNRMLSRLIAYA